MATGTYATTTLTQAIQQVGVRLMDPDLVRWTTAEIAIYIRQALRTWNALTAFYRDQATFNTTVLEPFYDLPTVAPTQRAQDYTDSDAISEICFHLLEAQPIGGVWQGSRQFTMAEVTDALQIVRDAFLLETGVVLTRSTVAVDPAPSDGRVSLDEAIANLRRVAWRTDDGIIRILRREDEWGLAKYARSTWVTPAADRSLAYSVGETPPLVLQMAPVTTATGLLDVIAVQRGPTIDAAAPQSLGMPNDFAWVVVFGTLAVLLNRDGLSYDPARAEYCKARYDQGVALAKVAPVVLDARVSGFPVGLASIADADAYSADWQIVPGVPRRVLQAGQTLVGCWPVPGVPTAGGGFAVVLDLVRNAPVPTSGGDFLQVGPELLDTILNYAQHLALFKEGVAAISQAKGLLDSFLAMSGTEVSLEWALSPNRIAAIEQTAQDTRTVPYETSNAGTIN